MVYCSHPFNPNTTISYYLPEQNLVTLDIYNAAGLHIVRLVEHEQGSGPHSVPWDGRDGQGIETSSGIYFLRLSVGGAARTAKVLLIR